MIIYLLKSSLCLSVFLIVYHINLERENMHVFKRFYLLISLVFSFVVPFISFEFKVENEIFEASHNLQRIVLPTIQIQTEKNYFSTILFSIYGLITFLFLARFIRNLYTIQKVKNNAETINFQNATLALVNASILPHTFGSTIFINKQMYESKTFENDILTQELTHVRQKHTLDVLLIEFLKSIFWFNPLLILYKRAIQLNHEFLANQNVILIQDNISNYQNLLILHVNQPNNFYLSSNLNSFLKTKKRFTMMTKSTSRVRETLSQLSVLPVLAGLIFISCSENSIDKNNLKQRISSKTEVVKVEKNDNESYPEFQGGNDALNDFIEKNYKVPNLKGLTGKLSVGFYIEADGSINDIKVYKDLGHGTAEEAIRVLKLLPKWKPATLDGKAVRVLFAMPIIINPK